MNVNTTNSYSTSAATNKGMSGMISGMDTEAMVEQMLSGTQGKIDKQEQEKQKIIWQQLKYREIIDKINNFQDTFFGSTSSTNLSSIDFFNSMSVNSSSKAFSAVATSDAAAGNMSVRVGQLATTESLKSGSTVSGGLFGEIDKTVFNREVVFNIGGSEKKVTLSAADPNKSDEENLQKLADELTAAGISAEVDKNGKLKMTGDFTISAKSSALGMEMLGVTAGQKSSDGSLTTTAQPDANVSFDIELNGIKRTITLEGLTSSSSNSDIKTALQTQIDKTFGSGWITIEGAADNTSAFKLKTNGKGNVVTVLGNQSGLKLIGMESGQSDKIARGQMLQNTNFATALQGDKFEFTINGESFKFTGDNTISDVMKAVNSNSKAGVRITYNDLEDKFTIEASETGAGREIVMKQQSGNLLTAMFGDVDGMTSGTTISSKQLLSNTVSGSDTSSYGDSFQGGYFKFKVDGKSYSISIPSSSTSSREQVFDLINEGLANRFGYNGDEQNIKLVGNKTDGYKLEVNNGAKVTFDNVIPEDADDDTKKELTEKNIQVAFGFDGASNVVKSADDEPAKTMIKNFNDTYNTDNKFDVSFEDGRIVLTSHSGGYAGVNLSGDLADAFGTKFIRLGQAVDAGHVKADVTHGQNAIAEINGVTVERSTNTFTTAGMTITLNEPTVAMPKLKATGTPDEYEDDYGTIYKFTAQGQILDANGKAMDEYKGMTGLSVNADGYIVSAGGDRVIGGSTETLTTSRNTDKIVEGLKSFVEKYNEMIGEFNDLIHEDATYRDYPPLTSAQKKEMSDREIELWEEKAQEGLYRNDSDISTFLQNMRSALYSKPEGAEYALYDIGIESSSEWKDYGKLEFNEAKVRSMVESNPQAVQELFTNATNGLSALMVKEIKRTANTSSGSAGTLVEKAGVKGKATAVTNQMTQRLISINQRIEELKKKYETERTRYWNQFNSMETALANMNSQSSWLAMQFS